MRPLTPACCCVTHMMRACMFWYGLPLPVISACMLLPGKAAALVLMAAVMRSASALVTPVTLDVLYMKLDRPPLLLTNVALWPVLPLLWLLAGVAGAVGVAAAVVLRPPLSLQLPGSLLVSLLLGPAACCADCGACTGTQEG